MACAPGINIAQQPSGNKGFSGKDDAPEQQAGQKQKDKKREQSGKPEPCSK